MYAKSGTKLLIGPPTRPTRGLLSIQMPIQSEIERMPVQTAYSRRDVVYRKNSLAVKVLVELRK